MCGRFQLLVKRYDEWGDPRYPHSFRPAGAVSNYLHRLRVGETALFRHVVANQKLRLTGPDFGGIRTITMLAVGAGVAPMIQALHALLEISGPAAATASPESRTITVGAVQIKADAEQLVRIYGTRLDRPDEFNRLHLPAPATTELRDRVSGLAAVAIVENSSPRGVDLTGGDRPARLRATPAPSRRRTSGRGWRRSARGWARRG